MNTPSFFVIVTSTQTLKLTATVDEASISSLRPGLPIRFQVAQQGKRQFKGEVQMVGLNATVTNYVVTYRSG